MERDNFKVIRIVTVVLVAIASLYPAWHMLHVSFDGLVEWNCFKSNTLFPALSFIGFFLQFFFVKMSMFTAYNVWTDDSGEKHREKSDDITDSLMAGCVVPLVLHLVIIPMAIGAAIYYIIMVIISLLSFVAPYVLTILILGSGVGVWFLADKLITRKRGLLMFITIGVVVVAALIGLGYYLSLPSEYFEDNTEAVEGTVDEDTTTSDSIMEENIQTGNEAKSSQQSTIQSLDTEYQVEDFSSIVCEKYLTDDDLKNLSKEQLSILRNTIFARHGHKFKRADLREYFSKFDWYTPRYDQIDVNSLSDIEKHNIQIIKKFER